MRIKEIEINEIKIIGFHKVWPIIVKDITETDQFSDIIESSEWFKQVLEKNVPFGKQNR